MKKSTAILASAVALVMAGSAIAETTVYGRSRMALQLKANTAPAPANNKSTGLVNGSSRFGLKGSEDLGNGMSAVYHYEFGLDATANGSAVKTRIGMVGLKGDFGTFAMGSLWTPTYSLVQGNFEPFNMGVAQDILVYRASKAIAYINKFGDVSMAAAIVSDPATDKMNDAYNIAFSIPAGPVVIGLGVHSNTTDSAPTLSVKYKGDGFGATLGYTDASKLGGAKTTSLVGSVNLSSSDKVILRVQSVDNSGTKTTGTTVGYHHNLSKRTQAFIEAYGTDTAKPKTTYIGLKHNF